MRDEDCVRFLRWALPRLEMRWAGFRKVRRQVCRRIDRRIAELGLDGAGAYRRALESDPQEWARLEPLCRVTISRFYRDRGVFDRLGAEVLPALAAAARERGRLPLRIWSAGCGAGEEPYTVAIFVRETVAGVEPREVEILGTDLDRTQIERARLGVYPASSLRELPEAWRRRWFRHRGEDAFRLRAEIRRAVRFRLSDLRGQRQPAGPFHLILCRNLAFTYYEEGAQLRILERLLERLAPGGALVIGSHETLPPEGRELEPWPDEPSILTRA